MELTAIAIEADTSAFRPAEPNNILKFTGSGIPDISLGLQAEQVFGALVTIGRGPDSAVTGGFAQGNRSVLSSAIEALQTGPLTPPTELDALLTQAVAARESRSAEDARTWALRLASEAAQADS